VLDTQVVLDWLVFREPAVQPLASRLEAGAVRWLLAPTLADELMQVLERPFLARWMSDLSGVRAAVARWAHRVDDPPPVGRPDIHPRCRDVDDQKFIDVGLHHRAAWLVTRDRALLALARTTRSRGLWVVTPAQWVARAGGR
jgi:predicted nucleic acid-binding protein